MLYATAAHALHWGMGGRPANLQLTADALGLRMARAATNMHLGYTMSGRQTSIALFF